MSTTHNDENVDIKNYISLSQFYKSLSDFLYTSPSSYYEEILKRGGDINYAIPLDSPVKLHTPNWLGYTRLHFAVQKNNKIALDCLLNHGADFTIKSYDGTTALRMAIENNKTGQRSFDISGELEHSLADSILRAHINVKNPTNPSCKNGISHFHIACMLNNTKAVELFLKSGVSVNEAVNVDSFSLPGYTPLHFAARYCSLETAEILVQNGADVHRKDAKGMTPLHVLIEQNKEYIDAKNLGKQCLNQIQLSTNERIINLILKKSSTYNFNPIDDIGLSHFHVVCTLQDESIVEKFLKKNVDVNAFVNSDSSIWSSYTPLHFAAHFNIQTVKLLLKSGANIAAKDVNGITPFDLCVERYTPSDIHWILSSQDLKNIQLSDNTKLLDVIFAMSSVDLFRKFLDDLSNINICVPFNSPLWPGYTLLHLVITFAKFPKYDFKEWDQMVSLCLRRSADFTIQDAGGSTPLHLAFRLQKEQAVKLILRHHNKYIVNPADSENLSHFHIACAMSDRSFINLFLWSGVNINDRIKSDFKWGTTFVKAGSTPLHISLAFKAYDITELLLTVGADPHIRDADGLTAIHLAFTTTKKSSIIDLLLSHSEGYMANTSVSGGLTYFHIACFTNNSSVVETFLEYVQNINCPITCGLTDTYLDNPEAIKSAEFYTSKYDCSDQFLLLSPFAGYTPLHFALDGNSLETIRLLISHGADVHAKNGKGLTPLHLALMKQGRNANDILDSFASVLNNNVRKCLDDSGLTMLHVACARYDIDAVQYLLNTGADVNARLDSKSPIWPGDTPLHVVANMYDESIFIKKIEHVIRLLLMHGADVTIKNVENSTPIHASYYNSSETKDIVDFMYRGHHDYTVNPADSNGFSHFHIACTRMDVAHVKGFLQCGADVLCPTDYFSDSSGGYSPLHFAMVHSCKEVVEVLLSHGADINAKDCTGSTPLHEIGECIYPCVDNIAAILRFLPDLHVKDIFGKMPLQKFLSYVQRDYPRNKEIKLLLEYGAPVNVVSSITMEGYIAIAFNVGQNYPNDIFKLIVNNGFDLTNLDTNGSNAVHNIVSTNNAKRSIKEYAEAIELLIKSGCELDHQDNKGRTALHVALKYWNFPAIAGLLMNGADVNIPDENGKTPLLCGVERYKGLLPLQRHCLVVLAMHVCKLEFAELDVNEVNWTACEKLHEGHNIDVSNGSANERCTRDLERMRQVEVTEGCKLSDFISEVAAVASYLMMPRSKRQAVDEMLAGSGRSVILCEQFPELGCLLKLQYRKAVERMKLLEQAQELFGNLVGIQLPSPCSETLFRFLSNGDLKNIISASFVPGYSHPSKRLRTK